MVTMEKIISLCKRRGFIFPGSEIYGGLANSWDYGPLGAQLRKNIKDSWWNFFVQSRADMFGLDAAILMNPKVWKASGHVDTFEDPLVDCKNCQSRFRADHIDEEWKTVDFRTQACPNCEKKTLTQPRQFNLMFQTAIGPVQDTGNTVYLRPETAQGIFVNFKNVMQTMRPKLPFGIGQIGKAFRNEITPGNFTFRTLEFEQMEIEYFVRPQEWEQQFEMWLSQMHAWGKQIGLDANKVHDNNIAPEELSHYSKRTVDVEFDYPFGRKELWGLAYRTDYDLKQHQEHSGEDLQFVDQATQEKFIPHVIEPSIGVDRTLLALLLSVYTEESAPTAAGESDTRVVLKFPPHIAPYTVAVLPLSKKPELQTVAEPLFHELRKYWNTEYDETQSIGKRYRRQDEIGTPFCVTVDFDSLTDNAVTVRDRDTMKQERIPISQLINYFRDRLSF
ncbi:MAG: glycine--tRNA ligase [Candidatus Kerfeldbacteria bacterium]|nr:glycine--tRNA ligase [Candidatus Kerfeldbacteria bacterium]